MFKSISSESEDNNQSRETGGKRGLEYEGNEDGEGFVEVPPTESLMISTVVSTVSAPVDDFMHTIEFKRTFAFFVQEQTLMALRVLNKEWTGVADAVIDNGVKSGQLMVHGGNDITWNIADALTEWREDVTRVIFLLNITNVGEHACEFAYSLVIVDIPEGVESISEAAFENCHSLTTVSFPTTLNYIGDSAFLHCYSLENVDLLHTNLQEIGQDAFRDCSDLKSIKLPVAELEFGEDAFVGCPKLVPSYIDTRDTLKVLQYLINGSIPLTFNEEIKPCYIPPYHTLSFKY